MTLDLVPRVAAGRRRPRLDWTRLRAGLFGSLGNSLLTIATLALIVWLGSPLVRWALLDAVWRGGPDACAGRGGACWAFIGAKLRFILFAFYPQNLQGRSLAALLLLLVLVVASGMPRFWRRELLAAWILGPALACLLLGGWGPLSPVATDQWGGLTLTVLIVAVGFAGAFPLGLVLALGRCSRFASLRLVSTAVIELTRAVPLIAVLYVATLLLPLALPVGVTFDKLLRAQLAIIVFIAAYMAETVRAGLETLPAGQTEAAQALGLRPWATLRLIVLPQALRAVIPGFVNLTIGLLQNTPLVAVIGLFDLLNAARASASDPQWLGFYNEAFAFTAVIYFILAFGASRYSLWLERRLDRRIAR